MTNELQTLLEISASLYVQLGEIPTGELRDEYIEEINEKLDARAQVIEQLVKQGFEFNASEKSHITLFELDKGIKERLQNVMLDVKKDMKELQNAKRSEQQYANPYGHVQTMDGMYYDKKK